MSRYVPVKGSYWWRIKIGDGEQTIGKFYSKDGADEICRHLDRAEVLVMEAARRLLAGGAQ